MYGGFSWELRIIEFPPHTFSGPCVWECSRVTQFEVYLSRTATNFMSWKMTVFLKLKKKKKDSILSVFVRKRGAISTPSFPWRENAVSEMGDSCLKLRHGMSEFKGLDWRAPEPCSRTLSWQNTGSQACRVPVFYFLSWKEAGFL